MNLWFYQIEYEVFNFLTYYRHYKIYSKAFNNYKSQWDHTVQYRSDPLKKKNHKYIGGGGKHESTNPSLFC